MLGDPGHPTLNAGQRQPPHLHASATDRGGHARRCRQPVSFAALSRDPMRTGLVLDRMAQDTASEACVHCCPANW